MCGFTVVYLSLLLLPISLSLPPYNLVSFKRDCFLRAASGPYLLWEWFVLTKTKKRNFCRKFLREKLLRIFAEKMLREIFWRKFKFGIIFEINFVFRNFFSLILITKFFFVISFFDEAKNVEKNFAENFCLTKIFR